MRQKPTNLFPELEGSLPSDSFRLLEAIAGKASQMGIHLYLVGGSVRDILLEKPAKDLDIVVEGNAATLAFEVSKELSGEVLAHSQFGTATLKLEGQRFDLATARQETYLRPGALPRVTASTIHEDLGRRDFTINSMAFVLSGEERGRLLDPYTGKKDLTLGLIRILHPRSFVDDSTRILRAVRYEQRLNFILENDTHKLMDEAVEGGMLATVTGGRIRRELEIIFSEENPHLPLLRCGTLGILRAIHPPLGDGSGVRKLAGLAPGDGPLAYLGALSYPLTSEEGDAFIHRLRMPFRWAKVVRDTISVRQIRRGNGVVRPGIGEPGLSPGRLCSLLDQFTPTSIKVNALLSGSCGVKEALQLYLTKLRYVKPVLDGRALIALGVSQGPLVGEVLRELRVARIEGRVSTREEEIQLAKEYLARRQL